MLLRVIALVSFVFVLVAPAFANTAAEPHAGHRQENEGSQYHQLNEELKARQPEVLVIGDDTVQFWTATHPENWKEVFGERNAMNLGVAGDRTQNVLWRLQNGYLKHTVPSAVIIQVGRNNLGWNTNEEIVEALVKTVDMITSAHPDTRVLLYGIFPWRDDENSPMPRINAINDALGKIEWKETVRYRDVNSLFMSGEDEFSIRTMISGRILSKEGYEAWAKEIASDLIAD